MREYLPPHAFRYEETDIPEGVTIDDWRRRSHPPGRKRHRTARRGLRKRWLAL
jgi:hypothetical protein